MIRRVASATILQLLTLIINLADRIVVTGLLLRLWGVSVFEDWSVLFAAASLFNLLDLGLHMTFGNSITQARQQGKTELYLRRISTSLFINLVISILGLAVLGTIALDPDWRRLVTVSRLTGHEGRLVLIFFGLAMLLQTVSSIATAIYRANGLYTRGLTIDACFSGLRIILVAITASIGFGPAAAAAIVFVVAVLNNLILVPWDQIANLRLMRCTPAPPDREELHSIASMASWFCVQQFANVLLQAGPLLILSRLSDSVGRIAVFLLLRTLINSVRQIINALSNALSIELAQFHAATDDGAYVGRQLLRSTRFISLLSSTALGLLWGLGDPFFAMWTGGALRMDFAMALVFTLGFLVSGPFVVPNNFLNYIGEAKVGAASRIVNSAVALFGSLTIAPFLGVLGVVIGLAAGEAIGLGLIYLRATARWTNLSVPVLSAHLALYNMAGLLPVLAAATLVGLLDAGSPLETFALRLFVLAPVALSAILVFGLSREDRETVWRTMLRSAKRGIIR
jgi:O-antigen/teichoic acid export membrane protein